MPNDKGILSNIAEAIEHFMVAVPGDPSPEREWSATEMAQAVLSALSRHPDEKLVEVIAAQLWQYDGRVPETWGSYPKALKEFWLERSLKLLSLIAPIMAARTAKAVNEKAKWNLRGWRDYTKSRVEQAKIEERKAAEDVIRATGFTGIFQRQEWQEYVRLAHLRSGEQPGGEK